MEDRDLPGTEYSVFNITLESANFDKSSVDVVIESCEPILVPKNIFHKLFKYFGWKYEARVEGYKSVISIDDKL